MGWVDPAGLHGASEEDSGSPPLPTLAHTHVRTYTGTHMNIHEHTPSCAARVCVFSPSCDHTGGPGRAQWPAQGVTPQYLLWAPLPTSLQSLMSLTVTIHRAFPGCMESHQVLSMQHNVMQNKNVLPLFLVRRRLRYREVKRAQVPISFFFFF